MSQSDTIYALASATGKSGVAVVRVSGARVREVISNFTSLEKYVPRETYLAKIYNPNIEICHPRLDRGSRESTLGDSRLRGNDGTQIDHGLVIFFDNPNSFTGEDVVEFHVHGSYAVIDSLSKALSDFGIRPAEAGEFSRRAFYNGKMDLTQMEGLADLIDSETSMQQAQALKQMSGVLEGLYEKWREGLVRSLALLEAYIDFPEEEIPEEVLNDTSELVDGLIDSIGNHLSDNRGEILRRGYNIAIVGKPNVGKSSLINYLAKREVAIVSDIEGTTRDRIEVKLDIAGYPVTLVDTAGIRDTDDIVEKEGVKRSLASIEDADLVLNLSDNNEFDKVANNQEIQVRTKVDKSDCASGISVETGAGIEELLVEIQKRIKEKIQPKEEPVFTRERHRNALNSAVFSLNNYKQNKDNLPLELLCEDLRLSARALGSITGKIDVEEILDNIFSSFCIGK